MGPLRESRGRITKPEGDPEPGSMAVQGQDLSGGQMPSIKPGGSPQGEVQNQVEKPGSRAAGKSKAEVQKSPKNQGRGPEGRTQEAFHCRTGDWPADPGLQPVLKG